MRELTPELRAVYDLSRAAAQGAAGGRELLDRICSTVAKTFGFTRVAILRIDEGTLVPLAAHGFEVEEIPRGVELQERPLLAAAADVGEATQSDDALAVPLMAEGRLVGILVADREGERLALEQATLDVLTTTGALAAVYLERALEADELRRVNDVARNFVALASHELRSPCAVVHGLAATLHVRGDDLHDEQLVELRRMLYEHSDRLRLLVDQLLDLSRLDAKAIEIRPRRFRVRRRLEETLLIVAGDHLRDVEHVVDPELEAYADPEAFDRVVSNLITNAFRYGEPPVGVEAEETDGHFLLRVCDHGPGVAPSFVPKLFERFARSDASSAAATGAGLGLSIAQSYAQAQGGELAYRDAGPGGACFELLLPAPAAV